MLLTRQYAGRSNAQLCSFPAVSEPSVVQAQTLKFEMYLYLHEDRDHVMTPTSEIADKSTVPEFLDC